ncbi:MAG: hypothetical protein ABIJ45_07525 [Candidatus Zixiibacteriota bacterium]
MNCNEFKNSLDERFGDIVLTESENEHLKNCPECREYYNGTMELNNCLSGFTVESASPIEFALMNEKLDRRIDRFVNRAFGFYRFGVRYGVAISAVVLVMFVSMIPNLSQLPQNYDSSLVPQYSYFETQTVDEDATLDDDYIGLVINNYSANNGYNSSNILIGDIEEAEYEYLMENLNVGDIL